MNASSYASQLDALHLELLHAAIPQQYDTIGVMMPGVAGRIGCRASTYRSAAKRLCRSGAGNVESLLAAFLSDAQCRRAQGRGYVQEVLWTVMLAASQAEGIPFAKRLEWLDKLAQCVDNWASCDLLGEAVKDFTLPQNEAAAFVFLDALIKSRNLWRIRLALVLMLAHLAPAGARPLKRAVQLSSAPEVLTCAAQSYYGSMGLAWAFSVYAVHDFSLVERVVADLIVNKRIDPATARRTAQKVRESFRSAQAEKASLSQNIQKALDDIPAGSLPAARNNKPAGAVPAFRRKLLKGTPPSAAL
ncbi:DNA alkylation repair protein [Sutterella wadsworthensis]|uniref:DNA alkylation repair protein n=1 Tax=Sutterella wadsworthensis TaxID=40545 RepID=UPI00307969E0